jgi:hypothetical protein
VPCDGITPLILNEQESAINIFRRSSILPLVHKNVTMHLNVTEEKKFVFDYTQLKNSLKDFVEIGSSKNTLACLTFQIKYSFFHLWNKMNTLVYC